MKNLLIYLVAGLLFFNSLSLTSAYLIVASHDFNDNDWNGGQGAWNSGWWHEGGNNAKIVTTNYPYEGERHLRLKNNNGYVDRSVNLEGLPEAKLSFWAKVYGYETGDFSELLASPDGANWVVLKRFTEADSGEYNYYEFNLTQYGLTREFYISIDSEGNRGDDHLYIDDLKIFSENSEPPQHPAIKTWHIQYNPTPNPEPDVDYWNLDLFDVSQEEMQNLQSHGTFVMCYFSAGSWENWRPDAGAFPEQCMGNNNGWPGEKWLDTRCEEVRNIMKERIDLGIQKGCDGFDPDNMDSYGNNPGFPLTENDSIDYYNFLADYIHSYGKQVGLKNSLEIINDVLPNMDWAVNEQCFQYNECGYLQQVISDNKSVFHIEYGNQNEADDICPQANALGFSTLIKTLQLDSFEIPCWTYLPNACGNGIVESMEECDYGPNSTNCDMNCNLILGVIASDGFENGWEGGQGWKWQWYHQGDSAISTDGNPYEGSYHLRLRRGNGYTDRAVDLSNVNNAKLSFWAKAESFEDNDFADFLVLGGNGWHILKQFTPEDSDGIYKYYEFDLAQYGLTDTFYISIDAEMSSTNDILYIDDIKIESL